MREGLKRAYDLGFRAYKGLQFIGFRAYKG